MPLSQSYSDAMTLFVRSTGDPESVLGPVERELHAVAPQVSVGGIRTGREIIDGGLFQAKVGVPPLAVFGVLALGATPTTVRGLILKEGMSQVITGVLLGVAPALLAARILRGMLFGIGAADPVSIAGAAMTLLAVALAACYRPARWATRVDPLVALRQL